MNETATDARTEAKAKPTLGSGKRRPGRAPGLGKVPGSGRKKGSGNHVTKDAKEDVSAVLDKNAGPVFTRLCQIALGRKIRMGAGPNVTTVYPSETSQMKAIEILARKLRPDLSAIEQTVDQTVREEPANTRDLSRAVLDVLRMAELEDAPYVPPSDIAPLPAPAAHTDSEKPTEPATAPEPENRLPDGVQEETGSATFLTNGSRVEREVRENGETFWAVTDLSGMFHRRTRDRTEAVEFAKGLPGIQPPKDNGAGFTLNGEVLDPADIGMPREMRESFFDDYKRPRVIRSRRELRGH